MNILIKIVGSASIVISTSIIGFYYSNINSYRINDLECFKKAISILKSKIQFSMTSLPEAMLDISGKTEGKLSVFFYHIYERLNEKKGDGIEIIWNEALTKHLSRAYFSDDDINYFKSLGNTLGNMDKQLQINNIEMINEYIDSRVKSLESSDKKTKRMYSSLGVLCGLLIAIILL